MTPPVIVNPSPSRKRRCGRRRDMAKTTTPRPKKMPQAQRQVAQESDPELGTKRAIATEASEIHKKTHCLAREDVRTVGSTFTF